MTGGLGLIGSATVKLFSDQGWEVIVVDNDKRQEFFGNEASTKANQSEEDVFARESVKIIHADIRDEAQLKPIIQEVNAIVHCAAQPSHPRRR